MSQTERMNSTMNSWEANPWDASDAIADVQLAGFRERAAKLIDWYSVRTAGPTVFGIEITKLVSADVEFFATHDGEELLLVQLSWHGFPDPPEWGLASRYCGSSGPWQTWGYFDVLPDSWHVPSNGK